MNRLHSSLTDWGLQQVRVSTHDVILDVGCGGGRTLNKLAAMASEGRIYGIDYSEASVDASRRTNRQWIDRGRVEIRQATVADLPFADDTFDLVTAVETHFWWPDLAAGMREIFRVLKPGGRLVVIAEFYDGGKHAKHVARLSKLTAMAMLTVEQHRTMFSGAGFGNVQIIENEPKGWICGLGEKPASSHVAE